MPCSFSKNWIPRRRNVISCPGPTSFPGICFAKTLLCNSSQEVLDGELGTGPWAGLRLSSAGVTCLDFTSYGEQHGLAGPHMKTLMLWMAERRSLLEPVWIVECVVSEVLPAFLKETLGDWWDIEFVKLCPTDLGFPMIRERMWAVGVRRDAMVKTAPLHNLKTALHRSMVSSGGMFWCMNRDTVMEILQKTARKRHKICPQGVSPTWEECLPEYQKGFLEGYKDREIMFTIHKPQAMARL